jgi:RNA polymerase sigma-70 factor, ECF subfamily
MSAAGFREALQRALTDEGDRLYGLALRVTRDADLAADAVQEAFASALEHGSSFRGDAAASTWLHRIVYNKAIDSLRRRGREVPWPEEDAEIGPHDWELAHESSGPEALLQSNESRAALEAALAQLTPQQRAIFQMREEEGLKSDAIGEVLGLSPEAVRVALHRARLKLRSQLMAHTGRDRA